LGDLRGLTVLEIGCGSGHTLEYMAKRGAGELWGIDLSRKQIETASQVVSGFDIPIRLIESPKEGCPDLPDHHFDLAVSLYAIGWTVDLKRTLANVYRTLKPGGRFVFSWEHPVYSSLEYQEGRLSFYRPYAEDGWEKHESWRSVPIVMHYRKLATYTNELIGAGFAIERVVEESRIPESDNTASRKWYNPEKARIVPPTVVFRCRKPIRD
jgi:ubiquinone/menaquinone biosynthesis C-methylase UbiE